MSVANVVDLCNDLARKMEDAGIPSYGQLLAEQWQRDLDDLARLRSLPPAQIVEEWPAVIDRLQRLTSAYYERD